MKYSIFVPRGAENVRLPIPSDEKIQKIVVPGVVVFDFVKWHNHRYAFSAFFYGSLNIYHCDHCKSKKLLVGAMQNLINHELHVDVQ